MWADVRPVAHRCRQLEALLQDHLENFNIHQEGLVSRMPKQVRSMTMREFGEKYNGDIQLALRGFQKDRLAAAGADANFGEIDKTMRKRKFLENHEAELTATVPSDARPLKAGALSPPSWRISTAHIEQAKTMPSPSKPKRPHSSMAGPSTPGRFVRGPSKPPGGIVSTVQWLQSCIAQTRISLGLPVASVGHPVRQNQDYPSMRHPQTLAALQDQHHHPNHPPRLASHPPPNSTPHYLIIRLNSHYPMTSQRWYDFRGGMRTCSASTAHR